MNQPIAEAPVEGRGLLSHLAQAFGLLALLSFLLPWLSAAGPFSGPNGLDVMTGAGSASGAPSIPLILAFAAMLITLAASLAMGRARGAALGVIGYAVALILAGIFVLNGIFAGGTGLGAGPWSCLAFLAAAIVVSRMALPRQWRDALPEGVRPYTEKAPLAAFFVGISSGFPYAM